ncbi:MAG: hypothetical protein HY294_03570 [Candidatus Rokubacteria bacterium]|nr:hypothetical protein [Candidatus Rokubacteria bacterium]
MRRVAILPALGALLLLDPRGSHAAGPWEAQAADPDAASLDTLLQAKWAAMKTALRNGNIAEAVSFIVERRRADYETAFRLVAGSLSNVDAVLTTIELVAVRNNSATYEMRRADDGAVMSFQVRFTIDRDGVWRLEVF